MKPEKSNITTAIIRLRFYPFKSLSNQKIKSVEISITDAGIKIIKGKKKEILVVKCLFEQFTSCKWDSITKNQLNLLKHLSIEEEKDTVI